MMRSHAAAALLLCLTIPACADGDDRAGRIPLDGSRPAATASSADGAGGSRDALPADAAEALDRGNTEFRAARYDAALASYRAAAVRAPAHAAPHYGVFMVAQATRNTALADSAMAAIRARTPDAGELTDSTLAATHDGTAPGAAPGGKLPPGHPAVAPKPLPPGHPPTKAPTPAPTPRTGA